MNRDRAQGGLKANSTRLGQEILAAFDRGRQLAIDRARTRKQDHVRIVLELLLADLAKERPSRGRSGRIRRRLLALGEPLSERHIRRIIRDTLMSVSDLKGVELRNVGWRKNGLNATSSPRSGAPTDRWHSQLPSAATDSAEGI